MQLKSKGDKRRWKGLKIRDITKIRVRGQNRQGSKRLIKGKIGMGSRSRKGSKS